MKKFANNSLMTGYKAMKVFQKSRRQKFTQMRGFLCSFAVVFILACFSVSAFTATYDVRNELELETILNRYKTIPDTSNIIKLSDNVFIKKDYVVEINAGESLTFELGKYNLQGNHTIVFKQVGSGTTPATVTVKGSTMAFGTGVLLEGNLQLNYEGIYTSGKMDSIGKTVNDNITVNLVSPGSGWNAVNRDVIIGNAGKATFNISSVSGKEYNWGKSSNVTIGNTGDGSGVFNISGTGVEWYSDREGGDRYVKPTMWINTDNFVVGGGGSGAKNTNNFNETGKNDSGKNTLNLWNGALLETGNFAVGTESAGVANVWGRGTKLDIKGTNTVDAVSGVNVGELLIPGSSTGELCVWDRAQVFLHYNDSLDNGTDIQGWANLVLGSGSSYFKNAYFQIDRGIVNAPNNIITFQNVAMFEGSTYGISKSFPTFDLNMGGNTKIESTLVFQEHAIFSPGYGSKSLWERETPIVFTQADQDYMADLYRLGRNAVAFYTHEDDYLELIPFGLKPGDRIVDRSGYSLPVGRYGQIDITNLTLKETALSIWDFDVQGNQNHANYTEEHQDYVNILAGGTGTLGGHGHFRPMPGYYTDDIEIIFMNGGTGGFNTMTIWPQRWFEPPTVANGTLTMGRHQTPFETSGISPNEKSVGKALDWIYNGEQRYYQDADMVDQEATDWFPVLDWVWGMNDDDFRTAMRQLSGETRAASFYMPIRSPWRYAFERVNWRKRDNHVYFGQQNILAPYLAKQDVWVTPYWDYMHMGDDGNTSSAHTTRVSFMAGYDRALSKHTAAGLVFGYSQPKLQQVYSRVIADDWLFGAHYNTRVANDFELKLWGSYGVQHYRLSRNVPLNVPKSSPWENGDVTGRYKGNSATASIQVSKPYSWGMGVIRPLAAIDYSYVKQSEAVERGFDPIALRYNSSDWSQLFGRVGVRGDFGWKRVSLTGSVAYSYQMLGSATPSATNQFIYGDVIAERPGSEANPTFDIQGPNLSRTFVNIGLGSQIYLNRLKSRMFFVQYNGNYGKRTNAQNASLGYQMTF